jgi:hypothetical protein
MTPTHHLLTPRSRSFAADAMDEHLSVLLDWVGRWGDPVGSTGLERVTRGGQAMRTLVRGNSKGIDANPGSARFELPKGGVREAMALAEIGLGRRAGRPEVWSSAKGRSHVPVVIVTPAGSG